MDSTCASGVTRIEVRMRVWRRRVLAAEVKKAGSASEDALRMPRPPIFTGSEACVHDPMTCGSSSGVGCYGAMVDTFASSYVQATAEMAGAAAEIATERKT